MATVVALFAASEDGPRLHPASLGELARLGITSISLLRDPSLAGVLLEGWAFEPRDAAEAVFAVVGERDELRVLELIAQLSLSSAPLPAAERSELMERNG